MRTLVIMAVILPVSVSWAAKPDIEEILTGLSLEHKIGQMHMLGAQGRELNEPMAGRGNVTLIERRFRAEVPALPGNERESGACMGRERSGFDTIAPHRREKMNHE